MENRKFRSTFKEIVMKRLQTLVINNIGIILILLLAVCLRFIALGDYPAGTYTDEAYGAFIAKGLMEHGLDDRGYRFPVYFIAWGSGMNALYSYLGMLFFKIFGISLTIYRIPQALFGVLGILAMYVICLQLFSKKFALLASFALTITPWHIMMCRFGLESNLAPNMFLIALMFLVLGLKKKHIYLIASAFFFGLTLYCYAITWVMIPLFFLLCIPFCWKWIPRKKETGIFIAVLFVLALPLLLFLAINLELLPEIRTAWFSIPKLTGFRGGELSLAYIRAGIKAILTIVLVEQGDCLELLSALDTGSYYYFTTPFMVFGVISHMVCLVRNYKRGKNQLSLIFLAWFVSAGIVSIINQNLSMVHINMIHIPVIFYGAYGVYQLAKLLRNKVVVYACVCFGMLSVLFFLNEYICEDNSFFYNEAPHEAVVRAKEIADEDDQIIIFGYPTYKFPNLLWREQIDIVDYAENVVLSNGTHFVDMYEYRNYRYIADLSFDDVTVDEGVYVIYAYRMDDFAKMGFEVERVNESYAVAAKNIP